MVPCQFDVKLTANHSFLDNFVEGDFDEIKLKANVDNGAFIPTCAVIISTQSFVVRIKVIGYIINALEEIKSPILEEFGISVGVRCSPYVEYPTSGNIPRFVLERPREELTGEPARIAVLLNRIS